jgi:hypothetical protein
VRRLVSLNPWIDDQLNTDRTPVADGVTHHVTLPFNDYHDANGHKSNCDDEQGRHPDRPVVGQRTMPFDQLLAVEETTLSGHGENDPGHNQQDRDTPGQQFDLEEVRRRQAKCDQGEAGAQPCEEAHLAS